MAVRPKHFILLTRYSIDITGKGDTASGSIEVGPDGVGNVMILGWADDDKVTMSVSTTLVPTSTSTSSSPEETSTSDSRPPEETPEPDPTSIEGSSTQTGGAAPAGPTQDSAGRPKVEMYGLLIIALGLFA